MRVVERLDVADSAQLLLQTLNFAGDFGRVGRGNVDAAAELVDAVLKVFRLGHVVEQAGEEASFLRGNLSSGSVSGDGAVTNGPDVAGTLDDEVFVDGETAARVLLGGDAGDEVLDDGADSVTCGPDEETVGNDDALLGAVGLGDVGLDGVFGDVLDHGLGHDFNLLLAQRVFCVVNELLGEGGKDVGESLNEGDLEARANLGNQLLDVLLEKVLQFTGELDTSRSTTDYNHVHQTVNLRRALALEGSSLNAIHDLLANLLSIVNLLEEAAVFADAGNAKGCVFGTNANNEHVVRDLGLVGGALDLGVVDDGDDLALRVNGRGIGFVVLDSALLVSQDGADRLHDGAVLNGARRA